MERKNEGNLASLIMDVDQLKKDLEDIRSIKDVNTQIVKLRDNAKAAMSLNQWDAAIEAIKLVSDEKERNLLLADLIEDHLIPEKDFDLAHEYAKFLTPQHEITTLVYFKLAVAEDDRAKALELVNELPTPQSRNFALTHLAHDFMGDHDIENLSIIGKMMVENARLMGDPMAQSFALRDIVKNIYLEGREKGLAKETAEHIPDKKIRANIISIIEHSPD